MAFNTNITAGAPPLLWSDVHEAFRKVNENFDILVATIGSGSGLTPLNFETLDTSVSPTVSNIHQLGTSTNRWKSVYTSEWSKVPGDELNGLWAGVAQIKGIGSTVNLPANSTIGGDPITGDGASLIIDPEKTFFKSVQTDNGNQVVANSFADVLNLNSGIAIQLVVDSSAESITFNNTGVTNLLNGAGVGVSSSTGSITITNTGVRSLSAGAPLPSGRPLGAGISVNSSTGDEIKITNTGILKIDGGYGITVSTDDATGISTVSFNSGVAPTTAFTRFHIVGDPAANDILSDNTSDTFNLQMGYGILLSNDVVNDRLTITLDQNIDIHGSVFSDNSSIMVDAVDNKIYASNGFYGNLTGNVIGNITGNVVGNLTGNSLGYHTGDVKGSVFGDDSTLLVDAVAGRILAPVFANVTGNLTGNVVGNLTGNSLGYHTGDVKGSVFGDDSTLLVDAVGGVLRGTLVGNVTGTLTGNIFTNLIDSADSSAITVTPLTIFQSDVTVENDLVVAERLTVKGSRVINLASLKAVVAASADFADFKTKIAALV